MGDSNARPDESSAQKYMLLSFAANQASGVIVRLEESGGTEIVTFRPSRDYREFLFSSEGLSADAAYKVFSGGTSDGEEQDGLYKGGSYSGGVQRSHFNSGAADENFIISGTGGVFSMEEGQSNSGPPGPQPPRPQPAIGL
jgi:hypothetical protein